MRPVGLPGFAVRPVLDAAVQILKDADTVQRLWNSVPEIEAAEIAYLQRAVAEQLYLIPAAAEIGFMSLAEMKKLYNGSFVRKGSYLRATFYDALLVSAPFGICPSCYQRTVSTLDHYLPKDSHPAFAVTPVNLVPCCSDCNKIKSTIQAASADLQLLHPYFDNVEDGVWLKATVIESNPPSVNFAADPPAHWSEIKQGRVKEHFRVLGLNKLFIAHTGRLIADIGFRMNRLFASGGAVSVANHLTEEAHTRRNPAGLLPVKNSWQIAAYAALSESEFFCAYQHKTEYD